MEDIFEYQWNKIRGISEKIEMNLVGDMNVDYRIINNVRKIQL